MIAYFNSPCLKVAFVQRMKIHIEADHVIQELGFDPDTGHGCAVGCTYNAYDPALGPARLGFPEWYENLREYIFENLPERDAPAFALASLESVRPGADLEQARIPFLLGLLRRTLARMTYEPDVYGQAALEATQDVIEGLEAGDRKESQKPESTAATQDTVDAAYAAYDTHTMAVALAAEAAAYAASKRQHRMWPTPVPGAGAEVIAQRDDLLEIVRGL